MRSRCLVTRKLKKRGREREQKTRERKREMKEEGIWFGYRCGGKHLYNNSLII